MNLQPQLPIDDILEPVAQTRSAAVPLINEKLHIIDRDREWCEQCSLQDEPFDGQDSPGVPRDIVDSELVVTELSEDERAAGLREGQLVELSRLSCGHIVAAAV